MQVNFNQILKITSKPITILTSCSTEYIGVEHFIQYLSIWTGVNFLSEVLKSVFILQDCSLQQIMDHETDIVKDTLTLHSDMQTLVYENYNKFISATDTVKKVGMLPGNDRTWVRYVPDAPNSAHMLQIRAQLSMIFQQDCGLNNILTVVLLARDVLFP